MNPPQIQTALNAAMAALRAGKWAEAEAHCQKALRLNPRQLDAHHLLGLVALQRGDPAGAVPRIQAAIALRATEPVFFRDLGDAYRALGRIPEAREAYEKALQLQPALAEAWSGLGILHELTGDQAAAKTAYEQAIQRVPGNFDARYRLGLLQQRTGDLTAALATFEAARQVAPASPEIHLALGNLLHALGRNPEALATFDRALRLRPNQPAVEYNRAVVLQAMERYAEAEAGYVRVLRLMPDSAEAYNNHGIILLRTKRAAEAVPKFRRALELKPALMSAWNNLGIGLLELGDYATAQAAFEKVIAVQPNNFRAHSHLAVAFQKLGRLPEFLEETRKTLALAPDHIETLVNYATALFDLGAVADAIPPIERVLQLDPRRSDALVCRGNLLMAQGRLDEALRSFQAGIAPDPVNWLQCSNYLCAFNFIDRFTSDEIARVHFEIGRRLEASVAAIPRPPRYTRHSRLKIGVVSPDLHNHSVARFVEPLFRHFPRDRVEFFAYADVVRPDGVTARLTALVNGWRNISGLNDDAVASQIRTDEIDVLIDLAGHTRQNRLRVFAHRAAPVQVTWLGYPNTTGLRCIDYRLTDALADPPGMTERLHTETLMRLEGPAWCFQQPTETTPVAERPRGHRVVFGSFNAPPKYSDHTIRLWSRVLGAVPNSSLLLKGKQLADPVLCERYANQFRAHGIDPARVEFRSWTQTGEDHLAAYNSVDVSLDTFPYHGTTTTCEALWMGVPVITRAGDAHVSRVGVSLLTHVGLPELVAASDDEFVAKAVALAGNPSRLAGLRRTLRDRMRASLLMNGEDFARRFERACREMVAAPPASA